MNLVDSTTYTNMYIKAADYRNILHNIFITNKYGFTSILLNYISKKKYKQFHLTNQCPEICYGPYDGIPEELRFDYALKENGLDSPNWDIRNIHAIMYVDILNTLSTAVIEVIKYLYNANISDGLFDEDESRELCDFYNFIIEMENTRGAITMLFDIRIYMDHFTFRI